MKLRFLKLPLLFVLFAAVVSCRKEQGGSPKPDSPAKKIVKQVTSSQTDFVSYEYNSLGNVVKQVSQWAGGEGSVNRLDNVYEYEGNKLKKWSNQAGYAFYSYAGERLEKSEHLAFNGRKISTLLYTFNSTGKLTGVVEQIANPLSDGAKETKVSYLYYPSGNVSRMDFAYREELTDPFTIHFSKVFAAYDNKKNPEPDGVLGNFLPGVVLQVNNPVRINNLSANGAEDGYLRYEYTYNEAGYPEQRRQFISTGNAENPPILFQYSY